MIKVEENISQYGDGKGMLALSAWFGGRMIVGQEAPAICNQFFVWNDPLGVISARERAYADMKRLLEVSWEVGSA